MYDLGGPLGPGAVIAFGARGLFIDTLGGRGSG